MSVHPEGLGVYLNTEVSRVPVMVVDQSSSTADRRQTRRLFPWSALAALMTGTFMAAVSLMLSAVVVRLAVDARHATAVMTVGTTVGAFVGSWAVQPTVSRWLSPAGCRFERRQRR
jgi:hypothetical protein